MPGWRSSKTPTPSRRRGRGRRWARRRPVRSLSATIASCAAGSVTPWCSGATTIRPPGLVRSAWRCRRRAGRGLGRAAPRAGAPPSRHRRRRPRRGSRRTAAGPRRRARPGAVAGHRTPAGRLDDRRVRRLGRRVDRPERPGRRRAAGRVRRAGEERRGPGARPHVDASAAARSSSSASRSTARSRAAARLDEHDLGRSAAAVGEQRRARHCRRATAASSPSPRRRHPRRCAPTARDPTARGRRGGCARWRRSSLGSSSRAGKISASARSAVERWSLTPNVVRRSTSSPHRSMRTGASPVDGNTSMIAPRRANSPRCSTSSSRR